MTSPRNLTQRERDVLAAMIERGERDDDIPHAQDAAERETWLAQVDDTLAYGSCGCSECPSIELGDASGPATDDEPRVVLSASTDSAYLMLFIDAGRLSYLELAPLDEPVLDFPPAAELSF
ncbi:hypothetical protein [Microbacterium halotolerans]|uniref:hypothetical protein n=1 Tax=Microbacterium halotolerans TaxID=246613 RepID=UPI000E6AC9EF|nr:hypothetical protein [Microbacterium halotolerans]